MTTASNNKASHRADPERRPNYNFMREYWDRISPLPDEERLMIYDAIAEYAFLGNAPAIMPVDAQEVWSQILPKLSQSRHQWLGHISRSTNRENENEKKESEETERSKEKEDKEKIEKEKEREKAQLNFAEELRQRFPRIAALEEPLTLEQYLKLRQGMESAEIVHYLTRINIWISKPDSHPIKSAYRTIITWRAKDDRQFKKDEKQILG